MPGARGCVIPRRRRRAAASGGQQQVVAQVGALTHLGHRNAAKPPAGSRARAFVHAQVAGGEHQVPVVVVEFRHRVARLVADRREPVHARDRGVDPIEDAVARVRTGNRDVLAGGLAPQAIDIEQPLLRGAVTGAFQAAAAGDLGVIGLHRRELVPGQEIEPRRATRRQRPGHRRFDEAVVVVVARVVDRPAAPGGRATAPDGTTRVPHVPDGLLGVVGPALPPRGCDVGAAGLIHRRQVGDHRPDLEVGVPGHLGHASATDPRFRGRHLGFDQVHAQRAVTHLARQQEHDGRVGRVEVVARAAVGGVVDPGLEARVRRRRAVDAGQVQVQPYQAATRGGLGGNHVVVGAGRDNWRRRIGRRGSRRRAATKPGPGNEVALRKQPLGGCTQTARQKATIGEQGGIGRPE